MNSNADNPADVRETEVNGDRSPVGSTHLEDNMADKTKTPETARALSDTELDGVQGAGIEMTEATVSSVRTEQLNTRYPVVNLGSGPDLRNPADGLAEYDESGPGIVHVDGTGKSR